MNEFSPKTIIEKELKELKPNEKTVISERFGLNSERKTLAAIGRDLMLSRERVRQIERDAKKKISKKITFDYQETVESIINSLKNHGGIVHKKEAASKFLSERISGNIKERKALDLFVTLLPEIEEIERDEIIHDSWKLISLKKTQVAEILTEWANYLKKSKSPKKLDLILKEHPAHNKHSITFLNAVSKIGKEIMDAHDGSLGLASWPKINPKTVRDKIYYVLVKSQKPLHFTEIAHSIKNENFDKKKVVVATVHNELIADKRFVLIGRGIYALLEWGYVEGTVKDVIKKVLTDKKSPQKFSDIYKEVIRQRQVRKNTVLINLQNQKEFKKVGVDKFILR